MFVNVTFARVAFILAHTQNQNSRAMGGNFIEMGGASGVNWWDGFTNPGLSFASFGLHFSWKSISIK